jgi:hypothetical protein
MQSNFNLFTNGLPSPLDMSSVFAGNLFDYFQTLFSLTHPPIGLPSELFNDPAHYNPKTRSWQGDCGLQYRIPVTQLPSEAHTRYKIRNIKILMDNCRRLCVNDELPASAEERKFWTMYGYYKHQNFLSAFTWILPPVFIACKVLQNKLPEAMRGRWFVLLLTLAMSEQVADAQYPGHKFLCTALKAKTPLGDAARAEWQRLQPIDIGFQMYAGYTYQNIFGTLMPEYAFGGDIRKILKL